jgi:DNA-binding IclR family transcriptional regulator
MDLVEKIDLEETTWDVTIDILDPFEPTSKKDYLAEIQKRTRLNQETVELYLQKFIKEDLIQEKEQGYLLL